MEIIDWINVAILHTDLIKHGHKATDQRKLWSWMGIINWINAILHTDLIKHGNKATDQR